MPDKPRIAPIPATPVAVDPIHEAFRAGWPEAGTVNPIDDGLSPDRDASETITEAVGERIVQHARAIGADGILFTCAAFGNAVEPAAALRPVPVPEPNEAMFEATLADGRRIATAATFPPARAGMEEEFGSDAERVRPTAEPTTFVVEPAVLALRNGDADTRKRPVAGEASRIRDRDAMMRAHVPPSRAATTARAGAPLSVPASPDDAVEKIRGLVAPSSLRTPCCLE